MADITPFPKMNPELKARWLEALRSGKYVQGQGRLYDQKSNGHCCLGVLCDIEGKLKDVREEGREGQKGIPVPNDGAECFLPTEQLQKEWGLYERPRSDRKIACTHLTNMNDGEPGTDGVGALPFALIADWIEQNL